jgi:hypothetical protein
MKRILLYLTVLFIGIACGFVVARIPKILEHVGGKVYVKGNEADLSELRRFVYMALPAKNALDAYLAAKKTYPKTTDELSNLPPHYVQECFRLGARFPNWGYFPQGSKYSLHMKLNWDGELHYDSETDVWRYSDAGSSWQIPL